MKSNYKRWLEREEYAPNVVASRTANVARVERAYGDIDEHFERDRLQRLIAEFSYTTADERRRRPNPTKIDFEPSANLRTGIATCKSAVALYRKFRVETQTDAGWTAGELAVKPALPMAEDERPQRIGLERDMQAALRVAIEHLEPGLVITDEGSERAVDSGLIDITARDGSGRIVVIELKAGVARRDAVSQVLSYMGDLSVEEGVLDVRGILVAASFDAKAQAAARVVPNLALRRYSVRFAFTEGHSTDPAEQAP